MIRAYFPAKYGLDRSSTDDMEEERVTQRLRLEIAPRTISKTSMNTNHAAPIANGSHISRLLSHGIIEGPGLQKQSLGYSGPEESVECALITVLQWEADGGGRPVNLVATCGCCSLRFLKSYSNLLPAEWPAVHPCLVWNLHQVHILQGNRFKSLFMVSFYSCGQWLVV